MIDIQESNSSGHYHRWADVDSKLWRHLGTEPGDCYLISPWEPHGVLRHRAGLEILLVSISRDELLKSFISKANFIRQLLTLPPKERMSIINIPAIMESAKVLAERLTAINVNYNDWNKLTQWHLITGFFISSSTFKNRLTHYAGRLEPAIELLLGRSGC